MAQILIVTQKLTHTVWQLAQSLSFQNDVKVLTSRHEKAISSDYRFSILTYFSQWSFFEFLRFIPLLLSEPPQIIHLMAHSPKLSAAEMAMAAWAKSQFQTVFSTSLLWDLTQKPLTRRARFLVEESQILTAPSVQQFSALRGSNFKRQKQGRLPLPPALTWSETQVTELELNFDLSKFKKILFVPWKAQDDTSSLRWKMIAEFAKGNLLVFWINQGSFDRRQRRHFEDWILQNNGHCHFLSEDTQELSAWVQKSTAMHLAGLSIDPDLLAQLFSQALVHQCPLFLDSHQSPLHGDFWQHQMNCFIIDKEHLESENRKVAQSPHWGLSEKKSQGWNPIALQELADRSYNDLSRLFIKATEVNFEA